MPFIFVSGDAQLFDITPLHSLRRAFRAIAHDSAHLSPGPFVGDLSGAAGVSRASRHFSIPASDLVAPCQAGVSGSGLGHSVLRLGSLAASVSPRLIRFMNAHQRKRNETKRDDEKKQRAISFEIPTLPGTISNAPIHPYDQTSRTHTTVTTTPHPKARQKRTPGQSPPSVTIESNLRLGAHPSFFQAQCAT